MNVEDLERQERDAVLAGDEAALEQLWDEQLIVNAPNNAVVSGRGAVLELVRLGIIRYARFERQIDRVELFGDVAVTMGSEKGLSCRSGGSRTVDGESTAGDGAAVSLLPPPRFTEGAA